MDTKRVRREQTRGSETNGESTIKSVRGTREREAASVREGEDGSRGCKEVSRKSQRRARRVCAMAMEDAARAVVVKRAKKSAGERDAW